VVDTFSYDAATFAVFGTSGSTSVNLLDYLTSIYGDQVSSITSIRIAYRDAAYFQAQNPDFSYWDPANPVVTRVLNNGVDIGGNGPGTFNQTTVANADFKNVTIAVGNNIMPNIYLTVEWANTGTDRHFDELNITTVPDRFRSLASFDGTPTAAEIVAMAQAFATTYNGVANANDCHWIAGAIAAAVGATLDPMTQNVDNPAMNEDGGYWRIVHRGSENAVDDWQALAQPGDIVRMGWTGGGFHTVTVTAGLNAAGQIRVVDNTGPVDASGNATIAEHWVDFDGNMTDADSVTIYRISLDQRNLINGSALPDTIIGTVLPDHIKGGDGNDTISGGKGNDFLVGNDGNDTLRGGEGNDSLDGGRGDDTMYGGRGDDFYTVDSLQDKVIEEDISSAGGKDAVTTTINLNRTLYQGVEDLYLIGNAVVGEGNELDNAIRANNLSSTLRGYGGKDTLVGYGGNDVLIGGAGDDNLDGNGGSDTAVFGGVFADYQIKSKSGTQVVLTDLRGGSPDGTDIVKNVESFRFMDKTVSFNDLQVGTTQPAGSVAIGDVTVVEGNNGTKVATFTVTRTGGTAAFDVNFTTSDGTATVVDGDYAKVSGLLHFNANETAKTISVTINGDTKLEGNETFNIVLSGATTGATIGDATGVGTISNDDVANRPPVATIGDHGLRVNEWSKVASWLSYSDADGNAATQYQFWDGGTGASSGYFWTPDNPHQPAGTAITVAAADLGNVWVRGGTAGGSETMWVRAFDGSEWGAWDAFNLSTIPNAPPVALVADHSVHVNEWAQVKSWLSYSDADGNAATKYQFWDGGTGTSSGYFWTPSNAHHAAGSAIEVAASDLGNVWVRGGTTGGSETMWVRAFDGTDWGAWDAFNLTTLANTAPVATIADHSLGMNEWAKLSNWLSYADADGNGATQYQFWDGGTGASSGYFWTPDNPHQPAGTAITVLAAELDNAWVRGGGTAGFETMWVRAFDGTDWGAWDAFTLTTR
jgi:Ca2+-binding RTX toxin-like protein